MAQPAPQAPPPYLPVPPYVAPPPPPKKSRTALYAVVAVVVAVLVVVIALAASGAFSPKSSGNGGGGGGPKVQSHTVNIVNTQNQTFGPGFQNAGVYPFTIPANATGAWVNGSFQVTVCTSIGNDCLGWAEILTPSAWSNAQSGAAYTAIFCYTAGTTTCTAAQNVQIASGDLVSYSGQILYLCVWSNASTLSQQYSADASLTYLTTS
jgi:hypothetical protein